MDRTWQPLKLLKRIHYDTYLHSLRVAMLAYNIGKEIALSTSELDLLHMSALLHDIGKVKLGNSILDKPGKLNPEEWNEIERHPLYGANILVHDYEIMSNDVIEGVYSHHESFNGDGYPRGLKGESISIYGRVIAIADALDAMTTRRIYKTHTLGFNEAINEVFLCEGTQFDPYICKKVKGLSHV
ncbi:HD-GYP domain-containing protein [Syntrophomonas wolfei]|jgi:putative nucleotidyltransferase with HDIG domain|uniref:HD-GYP domain-containing protein n=1 Tax=Syntrophomonas wolfei TaxID=863 RepID=UPI0007741F81|nr:HD domain-containing phosphohydrolase [Syntrophomonas wolfei]